MTKKYGLIGLSLLTSLFIYLFYRTDKTLINQIAIRLFSFGYYTQLKTYIASALSLNDVVVYSLPEGLWVFCITLTSKPYVIRFRNCQFDCKFIPLIFSFGLEILQLFHVTNGRFDFMDIGVSFIFWLLALYSVQDGFEKQPVFAKLNSNVVLCLASYGIVYLAHVFK